ncbi:DJ-1/PfpI family protein [Flavobacteriaceae bacterium 3-367]
MKYVSIVLVVLSGILLGATERERPREEIKTVNVAIFLYNGVELLDFSGPAEVFAATAFRDEQGQYRRPFKVYTVAKNTEPILSQGFLRVVPDYSVANAPTADIVVLPGGATGNSRRTPEVMEWVKNSAKKAKIMMSVCTGAFLLGDAGLLKNKTATTWYGAIERFKNAYPETEVRENTRYVDHGNIVTTAGVSAGIDGALHIVGRWINPETARSTAEYMEYDKWVPQDGTVIAP